MELIKHSLLLEEFKSNPSIWLYIFPKLIEELLSISMLMLFYIISVKEYIIVSRKNLFYKSIICMLLLMVDIFISNLFIKQPYVNISIIIVSIIIFRIIYKKAINLDFYPFMFLVFSCTSIYEVSYLFKQTISLILYQQYIYIYI